MIRIAYFLFLTITLFGAWLHSEINTILREKIESGPPSWMMEQIHADLKPFLQTGISKQRLEKVLRQSGSLSRIQIIDNQVYSNGERILSASEDDLFQYFFEILKVTQLPDLELIFSMHDSFYHVHELLNGAQGPIFSFAKRQSDAEIVLFPDREPLKSNLPLLEEVERGKEAFPWDQKKPKAFWRGANSGFLPLQLDFMNIFNYSKFPRAQLIEISKNNSSLVDARFNFLINIDSSMKKHLIDLGYVAESAPISEHLKYKYQILVDGFTCAFSRAYWQLFSNTAIFKQNSADIQWYYRELQPFVHYIPVAGDFHDLIEKIEWAKNHDKEVQKIIRNANDFARTHLHYEDILLYVYLLLIEYAKLKI